MARRTHFAWSTGYDSPIKTQHHLIPITPTHFLRQTVIISVMNWADSDLILPHMVSRDPGTQEGQVRNRAVVYSLKQDVRSQLSIDQPFEWVTFDFSFTWSTWECFLSVASSDHVLNLYTKASLTGSPLCSQARNVLLLAVRLVN